MAGSSSRVRSSLVECSRSRRRATSRRRRSLACNELGRSTRSHFHASPLGRRGRRRRGARPRRAVSHLTSPRRIRRRSPRATTLRLMPSTTAITAHCSRTPEGPDPHASTLREASTAPRGIFFLLPSRVPARQRTPLGKRHLDCTTVVAHPPRISARMMARGMLADPGTRRAV